MKACSCCGLTKLPADFHKDKRGAGGLAARCKTCRLAIEKLRYDIKAPEIKARVAAYKTANQAKVAATAKARWVANRDTYLAQKRARYAEDPVSHNKKIAEWQSQNADKVRQYKRNWHRANPAANRAHSARRVAARLKATPAWADQELIRKFYEEADALSRQTGTAYHVDHVVPLQSKLVCGLHNEFNLAVIPAVDNARKGNRHWPGMW